GRLVLAGSLGRVRKASEAEKAAAVPRAGAALRLVFFLFLLFRGFTGVVGGAVGLEEGC
ncbi:hypothetical protein MTO96_050089, partial [Rhipicephalus appendiculatus]